MLSVLLGSVSLSDRFSKEFSALYQLNVIIFALPHGASWDRGLINLKHFPSVGTFHGTSLQKELHLIKSAFLSKDYLAAAVSRRLLVLLIQPTLPLSINFGHLLHILLH